MQSDVAAQPQDRRGRLDLPGLPFLADAIEGGLRPGGTYLLAGAAGANKTTLAFQVASALVLNGVRVLYLSTEQAPTELEHLIGRVNPDGADQVLAGIERAAVDDVEQLPELLLRRRIPQEPGRSSRSRTYVPGPGVPVVHALAAWCESFAASRSEETGDTGRYHRARRMPLRGALRSSLRLHHPVRPRREQQPEKEHGCGERCSTPDIACPCTSAGLPGPFPS